MHLINLRGVSNLDKENLGIVEKNGSENVNKISENQENDIDIGINEGNNGFSKLKEILGIFSAIIAIITIVGSVLLKYISIGRYLYFDFDLDYCDFTITNTLILIFVFAVIATIISGSISFITYRVWKVISKCYKRKIYKMIIGVVLVIFNVIIYIIIAELTIPEDNLSTLFSVSLCILAVTSYAIIYQLDGGVKNYFKIFITISVLIILTTTISLITMEYDKAKNQTSFSIIIEEQDGEENYYVVINKGKEKYSAYLCDIVEENNVLKIVINEHKYFSIENTKTYNVTFDCVERYVRNDLTVGEFLKINN